MIFASSDLTGLLQIVEKDRLRQETDLFLTRINPEQFSEIFVEMAFLVEGVKLIQDLFWIQAHSGYHSQTARTLNRIISDLLAVELASLKKYNELFVSSSIEQLKHFAKNAALIEIQTVHAIRRSPPDQQKETAARILNKMAELFQFDQAFNLKNEVGMSLYRTFDHFDLILNLDYDSEKSTDFLDGHSERIFAGSGAGVQTSYLTILTCLRILKLKRDSVVIDLGSGYGRVGLVIGLLRPDTRFIGYEFVKERVAISNVSAKNFKIDDRVSFVAQDLSSSNFKIPEADYYYIYDSFSPETYKHVLGQLSVIAQRKTIAIVTKGDAKLWVDQLAGNWTALQNYDKNGFSVIASKPS